MNYIKHTLQQASLAGALRIIGAMIVVAAMCAHLLEGWSLWSDVSRYYALLGGTLLLALAGFATTRFLNENKGARVFVGLGLLSVAACLTTLGGLLHEWVQWHGGLSFSLRPIDWSAMHGLSVSGIAASALLVLAPVVWFAYTILARPQAGNLAGLFLLCGAVILIPIRTSFEVGLLIALVIALPVWFCLRFAGSEIHFKTAEGRFALASLFVPALIMVVRSLWMYQADTLLHWVLCVIAFVGFHFLRASLAERTLGAFLATLASFAVAVQLAWLTCSLLDPYVAQVLGLPVIGLVCAVILWLLGWARASHQAFYTSIAGVTLILTALVNLQIYPDWSGTCIGMFAGVLAAGIGWLERNRPLQWLGMVTIALALLPQLLLLGARIDFTHWLTLGVIGVVVIVMATLVERRRTAS